MGQLEDQLRGAYGEEKFTMAVSDIETRGRRLRRRRTTVILAVAAGVAAAAMSVTYVVFPWRLTKPPVIGPLPSASVTQSAHPVSRVDECRERMAEAGQKNDPTTQLRRPQRWRRPMQSPGFDVLKFYT